MARFRSSVSRLAQIGLVAFVIGCSSGSTDAGATGTISLGLSSSAGTVQVGEQIDVTGTLTRGGGFTGPVTIRVEGAPDGVTANADAGAGSGSSALVHVIAAASAAPGTYPLTVRAMASGLTDATAMYTLTIASASTLFFGLVVDAAPVTVTQGTSASISIGITRYSGFAAPVALAATGLPSGATASFDPTPAPSLGSLLAINVPSTVATGTYTVTVHGTVDGLIEVTKQITLVVTAPAAFSITTGVNSFALLPGTGGVTYAKATLGPGASGTVNYTTTGAPAGLTAAITPTSDPDSATVTITTTAQLAPGSYPIVVHATATGFAEQTATIDVVVGSPAGIDVRLDFSACPQVLWVGYQDGTGPWTAASGSGGVYTFHVNAATGGVAVVRQTVQFYTTSVQFLTQAELHTLPASCNDVSGAEAPGVNGTKLVNGTLSGVNAGDYASVSLGGSSTGFPLIAGPATTFHILSVLDGPQDMFAFRYVDGTGVRDRVVVRRDLDVADQGSLAPIDFDSSEAVPPVYATFPITGEIGNGSSASSQLNILSGASCVSTPFYSANAAFSSTTLFGFPATLQRPTDFYALTVTDYGNYTGGMRSVTGTFQTFAATTLPLGAVMPTSATVATLPGTYRRVQTTFPVPSDYSTAGEFYHDGLGHLFIVTASAGYRGSSTATVAAPDLSAVPGYLTSWQPLKVVQLKIFGTSGNQAPACVGGTSIYAEQIIPTQ